ncbi:MAG: hypothetical protein M1827_005651 [Pycnora praestabilis]|nr:MAG: hypothetical protein M1827_005651 [Pycnora praestabilis]
MVNIAFTSLNNIHHVNDDTALGKLLQQFKDRVRGIILAPMPDALDAMRFEINKLHSTLKESKMERKFRDVYMGREDGDAVAFTKAKELLQNEYLGQQEEQKRQHDWEIQAFDEIYY